LNTLETLRGMIAEKFEVLPDQIQPAATLETLGLDSLAVFDLIFDIESKFAIKVENDQVKIETVADVVELIDRLRQEQGKA
jgi:acyl carrier protein